MIRVYRYGSRSPSANADIVRAQMSAAHRYHNVLIEIENGRRAAHRALDIESGLREALDKAVAAEDEVKLRITEVMAHRAVEKTRKVPDNMAEGLKAAKEVAREAKRVLAEKRAEIRARTDLTEARVAIDALANELHKSARAYCGVYWGTYLLVEAAVEAAVKTTPLWDGADPNDVRFVRWTGEGAVGVQLQGGLPIDELADDTRLRLADAAIPLGPKADPNSRRSLTRTRKDLHVRVGSDEKKKPIWATFPVLLHRPLPDGAVIKAASVHLRLIGPREEWSTHLTLEIPEAAPTCGEGVVALHLGWRSIEGEGVRVATYQGEGKAATLLIPETALSRMERPDQLRGTRDDGFNRALKGFVSYVRRTGETVPEWVRRASVTAHAWRSADRLARIVRAWAKDEGIEVHHPDYLAWVEPAAEEWSLHDLAIWRYHDHHLWEWETSLREKVLRNRRDTYRVFAANLAKTYRTLVVEDVNLADLASIPAPATPRAETDNPIARAKRVRVAPGELRATVIQAFTSAGGRVVTIPKVTAPCAKCGTIDEWDRAAKLMHRCTVCESIWDQDFNAVANILAHAKEKSLGEGAEIVASEGKKEGRWAKAKAAKAEKEAARAS